MNAGFALPGVSLPPAAPSGSSRQGNRLLPGALLVSAVFHALALGWLPGFRHMAERAPLPLRILLPVPADAQAPAEPPAAVLPAPTPVSRSASPAAGTPARSRTDEPMTAPPRLAEEPAPAVLSTPAVATAAPTAAPSTLPPVAVAPSPSNAPDPQALAGYGRSVAGALAGYLRYPRLAQMRQWQGTTILQLEFAADGRLVESRVLSSSGHDVLDRQALDMLRAALPLPSPPAALAGRPLVVNVPVVFRLAG